jgi:hypothetical protein
MTEITLYSWDSAPYWMKRVSTNGGDEDWVAVSESKLNDYAQTLYLPTANHLDEYYIEDEDLWIYIGAHS